MCDPHYALEVMEQEVARLRAALQQIATWADANAADMEGRVVTRDIAYGDVTDWEVVAEVARTALEGPAA
jgi:hypothetical protein